MAESVSLAVLENLVHLSKQDFPIGYVSVSALIPDDLKMLTEDDFKQELPSANPIQIGDLWLDSVSSPVLRVRSAVIPAEFNYLLNPTHPEFSKIVVESSSPFFFDERLFTRLDRR